MFNLEAELRTRLRDQKFCEAIRHPLIRVKRNLDAYEDVYDGSVYPNGTQYGQLHTLGSTDGIRVFKTTVEELWLVMMVVLELPPEIRLVDRLHFSPGSALLYSSVLIHRYKQDNMVILGAWWGRKPHYSCFLSPLAEQLNILAGDGFVAQNHLQQPVNVTLRMLTATADNPAKEALENYKSSACGQCHQVGKLSFPKKKKKGKT